MYGLLLALSGPSVGSLYVRAKGTLRSDFGHVAQTAKKSVGKLKDRVYSSLPTLFLVIGARHYLFLNM